LDTNVQSIAADATGSLFALDYGTHQVYEHTVGSNWNVVTSGGSQIGSIAVDATGNLWAGGMSVCRGVPRNNVRR